MRDLQQKTTLLLPRLPFQRLVREIVQRQDPTLRMSMQAVLAIQESCEVYLSCLFDDAQQIANHANRKTCMRKDLQLARRIRGEKPIKQQSK